MTANRYGSVAARIRESKDLHPENYCANTRCLWRVVTRGGIKPCPKHPKENTMARVKGDTDCSKAGSGDLSPRKTAKQLLGEVQALLSGRKFTGDSAGVRRRQRTEETIVLAVALTMLDAGYLLGVMDGEELTVKWSRDIKAIQKALFTTDEDYLYVYEDRDQDDPLNVERDPAPDYWVRCVYGNDGYDVISDYSSAKDLDPYISDEDSAVAELTNMAEDGNI